jgi:hypothetical protein
VTLPSSIIEREPGPKIVENDSTQSRIVHPPQKKSMNIEPLDPESIRTAIFDPDTRQTLPDNFQYLSGNIETRISSRVRKKLFLQTGHKIQSSEKTILKRCATAIYFRGYSSDSLKAFRSEKIIILKVENQE